MKSYLAKPADVQRKWYLIDASNEVLGRLAVKIANILRGRNNQVGERGVRVNGLAAASEDHGVADLKQSAEMSTVTLGRLS